MYIYHVSYKIFFFYFFCYWQKVKLFVFSGVVLLLFLTFILFPSIYDFKLNENGKKLGEKKATHTKTTQKTRIYKVKDKL